MKGNSGEKVTKWKIALLVLEGILISAYLVLTVFYVWFKVDQNGFIKKFSKNSLVRMYLSNVAADDYEEKVQDTAFNKENVTTNKEIGEEIETYRNIALFGIDSRNSAFDDQVHSDSIIIVSINNKTGEVKLASVYRDTMLKMKNRQGEEVYTKANAAFFMGGAENAVSMLNINLDLNITDYAVVNFTGLTKIIDALGGIDVTITPQEKFYINGYLVETREITRMDAPDIAESGHVHLSGLQATAYCRIRYVTFTDEDGTDYHYDMGRTARQRSVLKKLVAKAKLAGAGQVMSIADSILNYNTADEKILTTSLSFDEVMDLIPTMLDFELTETMGFPFTCDTPTVDKASVVVANGLSYNVTKLHEYLFGEKNYVPSLQVQNISDYLEDYTGIPTIKLKEDETGTGTEDENGSTAGTGTEQWNDGYSE